MAQAKVNRDLADLEPDLTSPDMRKDFVRQGKLKINSMIHRAEENNVPPSQTIISDNKEEALAGAATTLSLLPLLLTIQPGRILARAR